MPFLISLFYSFVLVYGFYVFDKIFNINFKTKHYIIITLIAFTGPTLVAPLLHFFIYYDKIMHFAHPFLFSSIAFFVVSKLKIKKTQTLFLVFFIVIASFAIFEVMEYLIDLFLDYNLQGVYSRTLQGASKGTAIMSPIDDTMTDLILGIFGAFIYLILGLIRKPF